MNILLIDDDEVDRKQIQRLILDADNPFSITMAATAEEGLALFEGASFDIVLLDLLLPDMDGLDVLKALRAHVSQKAAIIILTGGADELREAQCMEAGAQDFLLKDEVSNARLRRALMHSRIRYQLETRLLESSTLLEKAALEDPLTEIGNRRFFTESLVKADQKSALDGGSYALFVIDVDNFKLINDNMGYSAGDRFLTLIARRLSEITEKGDIVCRLGGDEFALIVNGVFGAREIDRLALHLLETLSRPIKNHNFDYGVSFSIGVALNNASTSGNELLKYATTALKLAKNQGKRNYVLFSESHRRELDRRNEISFDLGLSETESQFEVYYQPLISTQTLEIVGAEALLRWQHPTYGMLPPGQFIEIAKDIGCLNRLDALVRRRACQQLAEWRHDRIVSDIFKIACNSCAATLMQSDFSEAVLYDISEAGLPCSALEIEVTEDDLITDFYSTSLQLSKLRSQGVSISIDDFGTGYSSMTYLKSLPSSRLKIDRSFLKNVPAEENDNRILRAMITMAKSLDLDVTIEGIEVAAQASFCRKLGTIFQGFYFAKPMPAAQFAAFSENHEALSVQWKKEIRIAERVSRTQKNRDPEGEPSHFS